MATAVPMNLSTESAPVVIYGPMPMGISMTDLKKRTREEDLTDDKSKLSSHRKAQLEKEAALKESMLARLNAKKAQQAQAQAPDPAQALDHQRAQWKKHMVECKINCPGTIDRTMVKRALVLLNMMPKLFSDELKKLPETEQSSMLERLDLVKAVATGNKKDDDGNAISALDEAVDCYYPLLQKLKELRDAITEKLDTDDASLLRDAIETAESDERKQEMKEKEMADFMAKFFADIGRDPLDDEIPPPSCPYGDVVRLPDLCTGPPRMGKSMPAIAFALLARMIGADVLWSVAPDKRAVMREFVKKLGLMGCAESGLMRFKDCLDVQKGSPEAANLVDTPEYECLVFSSDEKDDCEIYAQRAQWLRDNNRFMLHVHDEPETMCKEGGTINILRRFFPTSWGSRMLIGATLLPLLQEAQLWGSNVKPDCETLYNTPQRPLHPASEREYIGMENTRMVCYDDSPGSAFTKAKVIALAEEICVISEERKARRIHRKLEVLRDPTRLTNADHPANKLKEFRGLFNRPDALKDAIDKQIAREQRKADRQGVRVRKADNADFDSILDKAEADTPHLPLGLVAWGQNPISTAKMECFWRHVCRKPASAESTDSNVRLVNHMFVALISKAVKDSKASEWGGMATWAVRFCEIAKEENAPCAFLLYATGISVKSLASIFDGFVPAKSFSSSKPVSLLEVRVETSERHMADGSVQLVRRANYAPVNSFYDSDEAFQYLTKFEQSGLTPEAVLKTHVGIIGYDLLRAATTVANERTLVFTEDDGTETTKRLLYTPRYGCIAHNASRQLNALLQQFGRTFNQLPTDYRIDGYYVSVLGPMRTLPMLKVYSEAERTFAAGLYGAEEACMPLHKVVSRVKMHFDDNAKVGTWDGDITAQLLGLRRVSVKEQFQDLEDLDSEDIELFRLAIPEDVFGADKQLSAFEQQPFEESGPVEENGSNDENDSGDESEDDAVQSKAPDRMVNHTAESRVSVGIRISTRSKSGYPCLDASIWQPVMDELLYKVHWQAVEKLPGKCMLAANGKKKSGYNCNMGIARKSSSCKCRLMELARGANFVAEHSGSEHPLLLPGPYGQINTSDPKRLILACAKYPCVFQRWLNDLPEVEEDQAASIKNFFKVAARNLYGASGDAIGK